MGLYRKPETIMVINQHVMDKVEKLIDFQPYRLCRGEKRGIISPQPKPRPGSATATPNSASHWIRDEQDGRVEVYLLSREMDVVGPRAHG